jgi:hypothetical protein
VTKRSRPSELEITRSVAQILDQFALPGWLHTHFPAGEKRSAATGERLKSMGLKPGFPDFLLIGPDGKHYWLEIKRHDGVLSPAQRVLMTAMVARGIPYAIARSPEDGLFILNRWGVIKNVRVAA